MGVYLGEGGQHTDTIAPPYKVSEWVPLGDCPSLQILPWQFRRPTYSAQQIVWSPFLLTESSAVSRVDWGACGREFPDPRGYNYDASIEFSPQRKLHEKKIKTKVRGAKKEAKA